MTDKQKLQSLFDAALKAPAEIPSTPQRAFPTPSIETAPVVAAQPAATPAVAVESLPQQPSAGQPSATTPQPAAPTLDAAAAEELGKLLDDRIVRKKRRRRLEVMVSLCMTVSSTAGGAFWFVQDEARVQALREAINDIRSVGDVKSLVAKYQDALDRVGARGRQIEQATAAMGVKASAADEEDPFFDKEMKDMMGEDGGKTVGERNRLLKQNFSHMEKEHGPAAKLGAIKKLREEQTFDWNQ